MPTEHNNTIAVAMSGGVDSSAVAAFVFVVHGLPPAAQEGAYTAGWRLGVVPLLCALDVVAIVAIARRWRTVTEVWIVEATGRQVDRDVDCQTASVPRCARSYGMAQHRRGERHQCKQGAVGQHGGGVEAAILDEAPPDEAAECLRPLAQVIGNVRVQEGRNLHG